jgi:V-type H+-transporting ATPase subunit a
VPTYKEFNPAVFAIVTFPFLFGVMFGDIGHGLSLFLLSTFLCLLNQRISAWFPELNNVLKVRYMLLMMGLFASYCGFIYNDMMSIPVNLHKSCYEISSNGEKIVNLDKNKNLLEKDCTYYFGVDPIWGHSKNELNFVNSLKMKMAVILGVMQMSLGIFIKALNSLYFKDYLTFFNEFIP